MTLLRNICGLAPPVTGWDVLPVATDTSCEADIARFKYFRNEVYARGGHASVDDSEFHRQWKDIRDTLVRLGGVNYEVFFQTQIFKKILIRTLFFHSFILSFFICDIYKIL